MALPTAKVGSQKVDLALDLKNFIILFFKEREKINEENKEIRRFNRTASEKERKRLKELPSNKVAALLEGPPGIGKTSMIYALANDMNMEILETNASDTRTRDSLERMLKESSKTKGIMDFVQATRKKIILIDEVDGIYGTKDRGAIPAILDLIHKTQFPIVMCSNEYKTNLQSLYNNVRRYEVSPLSEEEVMKIGKKILNKEGIENISPKILQKVIEKNAGDLRGVINDLQGLSQSSEISENDDLLAQLGRDTTEEIFTLIRNLFQNVNTLSEARALTNKADVDYNFLYKWVNENLPTFIYDNHDIKDALDNLAYADEIFGRIRRNMYWSLLPYFYDLFAGGVALSIKRGKKTKGFRRVKFPRYSSSSFFSLNSAQKSLYDKLSKFYDISEIEAVQDFYPFLKLLASSSRKQLKLLSDWLELDAKERKLLK